MLIEGALIRPKCYLWGRKEFVKPQKWMLCMSLQVSFCVPPSARYKPLLHHASFKNVVTSGRRGVCSQVGFQLRTQHLICPQRAFAVSCLCVHILCVHCGLGLGICPIFLHSWCASELNTFYHEIQVIGWLQH